LQVKSHAPLLHTGNASVGAVQVMQLAPQALASLSLLHALPQR